MNGEQETATATAQLGKSLMDLFERGGVFMWPLLFMSVIAMTLFLYKFFDLALFTFLTRQFRKYLTSVGKSGSKKMLPYIEQLNFTSEIHRSLFHNMLQLHFDRRTRILTWFNAVGTGASMIGFIGTVAGMITAFDAISKAEQVSVQLTASGISEALITTGFGLIIAVACLLVESYFRYGQTTLAHQLDAAVDIYMLRVTSEDRK